MDSHVNVRKMEDLVGNTQSASLVSDDPQSAVDINDPIFIPSCDQTKNDAVAPSLPICKPREPIIIPNIKIMGKNYSNVKIVKFGKHFGNVKIVQLASLNNLKIVSMPKKVEVPNVRSDVNITGIVESATRYDPPAIDVTADTIEKIVEFPDVVAQPESVDEIAEVDLSPIADSSNVIDAFEKAESVLDEDFIDAPAYASAEDTDICENDHEEVLDEELNPFEISPPRVQLTNIPVEHPQASFLCKNCRFEFHVKPFFNLHFSVCNELRCFRCQSQFETLQDSYIHQQSCAKYYACKVCKRDFNTAKHYRSHLKKCKKRHKVAFSCKRCREFTTSDVVSYENHMRKCDSFKYVDVFLPPVQTFRCEVCDLECKDSAEHDRHTSTCGLYICACRADFPTLPALIDHSTTCRFSTSKYRSHRRKTHDYSGETSKFIKSENESDDAVDSADEIDEMVRTFDYISAIQNDRTADERRYDVTSNDSPYKSCLDVYEYDIDDLFTMLGKKEFAVKADLQCTVCKRFTGSPDLLQTHLTLQHNMTNIFHHFLCGYCNRASYRISNFTNHSYHYHVVRSCKICYTSFNSLKELQEHITMDHLEGGAKELCPVCSRVFEKEEIAQHRQWHAHEEEKQCEECGKILVGGRKYAMHTSAHRCNSKVLCPHCGRMVHRYLYNWHQKKKHSSEIKEPRRRRRKAAGKTQKNGRKTRKGVGTEPDDRQRSQRGNILPAKKHFCAECNKYFDATTYKKHERAHESGHVRAHQCQYCKVSFRLSANLDQHIRSCHSLEKLYCPECDLNFDTLNELYDHKRTQHQRLKTTFLCCSTAFARFSQVEQHFIDFHPDGKCVVTKLLGGNLSPFLYNLVIAREEDGKKHIRVLCGHCGKLFKTITRTNMHIEVVHIGTRRYMCSYCEMSFKNQEALTHHEYRHLDLKPYKCTVCGQCFRQSNDWKKHERRHEQSDVVERRAKKRRKFEYFSESD